MSDQRFISADAAPRLTSHLRALSLIAPLQRAEDNKGMLHVSAKTAERVDMRYLALAAIELLIDRMGAGGTAGRAELIEYLADLARLQSRNLSDPDATALAEHVFDGLTNARDRRARFKVRLFDPDQPEGVFFEFALLRAEPLPDGTVGYRLTQEAIEIHLSLLAHDPLTATQVSEIIVGEFLKRGLYDHAASAAERTRTNSIRLAEAIRLLMAEARRAILKVMWHEELGPKMEEARSLLDASIMREGAMLAQLSDTAADVTDETDRRHLSRIRTLLLDVQTRHRKLIVVVQKTADEYLHLQADTLKLRPLARLPDLENEILDPLLRAPANFLIENASGVFGAISGTLPPLVLDIAAAVAAFEPDVEEAGVFDPIIEFDDPTVGLELPFDEATITRAEQFARATILATGAITLGELLSRAASDRPDDAAFQRCLFLILEQAIDPRTTDVAGGASILSTRFDAGFVEGTDVRFSRATGGGVHASQ
ncbi:MAG: hypothetical protein J0H78_02060 [Rhizobiales bacterium]|jgi:hypothetical protein|uniref:Uncharacterized protein n=2 Tax=Pseudorhodoplanes TaxID=1734920 RepID=A0A1W6ZV64_9HYPH|nr:hypothetical protein [Pseudorhodoplanes sinuspersici]MBN9048214.1 hypothetical protein [Hyphomicrobiales bacterium]OJY43204.1 MAG: hypothetical protein BGP08_21330 [Rhizobiales bacterium 64-17]HWM49076.1 hypothetical protein [Xanthobacteraceae bacterium]ARQ01011.1 hypothetical protein CAK95_19345 [Pseudorhodoplanes sinuspersici]RKE72648.1 hypothetical protein DFP91_0517 [Pseudorhodoplanes sinuspersici]